MPGLPPFALRTKPSAACTFQLTTKASTQTAPITAGRIGLVTYSPVSDILLDQEFAEVSAYMGTLDKRDASGKLIDIDDDSDFKLTEAMPDTGTLVMQENNERQEALGFLMENLRPRERKVLDLRHAIERMIVGLAHDRPVDAHLVAQIADLGEPPRLVVRHAEIADLALALQVADRPHGFGEWRGAVFLVQVIDIDCQSAEVGAIALTHAGHEEAHPGWQQFGSRDR